MKLIPLTQGMFAIVDDEDFDFLSQWKWHVCKGATIYAMRNSRPVGGKRTHILMHRVLCETPEGLNTDHINGDGLDNRRVNLRAATREQNMWNRKPNQEGSSRFKGVYWHKQHRKWVAAIQVSKKRHHIGLFNSEADAAEAYAARAAHEFADFNRSTG